MSLSAAFLLLSLLSVSRAADLPEIAVVGLHLEGLTEQTAVEGSESLVLALESTGRVKAVPPSEVGRRIAGREPLILNGIFLGPGQKLLDQGRLLLERAEADQAIPVLEKAVAALRDSMTSSTDSRPFLEALLALGVAHATMGEQDSARKAFHEVARLDPGRELDTVNYPPRIVELFAEVRLEVQRAGSGSLLVNAPGDSSEVFVDGRALGKAPASVSRLSAGEHSLLVIGQKGYRTYLEVQIPPGGTIPVKVALENRTLAEPADNDRERSRQIRELYRSLGEHVQTDLILVGGLSAENQLSLQLYSTRSGSFSKMISVDPGKDPVAAAAEVVASLAAFPTSTGDLRGDKVGVQVPPLRIDTNSVLSDLLLDPEPNVQIITENKGFRWYVWAGAGAVVAAGATGLTLALTAGTEDNGQHGTIVLGPIP